MTAVALYSSACSGGHIASRLQKLLTSFVENRLVQSFGLLLAFSTLDVILLPLSQKRIS